MSGPDDPSEFFPLAVAQRREVAKDIVEFTLRDPAGAALPSFAPGAHLRVTTPLGVERKYSLTNSPADSREQACYVIAVKREGSGRGGSVSMVDGLQAGAALLVTAPDNAFPMVTDAKRFIFIAGGIGITPILGMVRTLLGYEETLEQDSVPFKLYYLTRDAASTAYREEISALGPARAVLHHDGGDAANTFDLWPALEKPAAGTHVYCCGPRPLMDAVRDMSGHWPASAIHFESFGVGDASLYEPNQAFTVVLGRSGMAIPVAEDESVLEALRNQGQRVPSSCEAGSCGTCRTVYTSGDVEHRDMVLMEDEKADQIMVCVSRARGGELVLDL